MDTGDILIPLSQLKEVFPKNSSRLYKSYHNRMVERPVDADFGPQFQGQNLYWLPAFESPKNVKTVVKKEIGNGSATRVSIPLQMLNFESIVIALSLIWAL